MIARLVLLVLAAVALDAPDAEACPKGRPCNKYKRRVVTLHEPVYGYTHSHAGAVPSVARVAAFLARGTWKPITTPPPGAAKPPTAPTKTSTKLYDRVTYNTVRASALRFASADKADSIAAEEGVQLVLIRRIEKHGKAILVEVDDDVWKLAPCPRRASYACLQPAGDLALTPIEPPEPAVMP